MKRDRVSDEAEAVACEVRQLMAAIGSAFRSERRRRLMTQRLLGDLACLQASTVHYVETGRSASLEAYVRLARALRLRLEVQLLDPRRHMPGPARAEDPVHAAMGEIEAAHLRGLDFQIGLDEPFQHFQHAGRADVVAWSREEAALLHIENRTRFPNLQEAFGSFNNKRAYLGAELARRVGVPRWRSETHVIVALWSAETLHQIRIRRASFAGVCPDGPRAFESWWCGEAPADGRHSTLLLFDPIEGSRSDRPRWVALDEIASVRPRYRGYAEALTALREHGLA